MNTEPEISTETPAYNTRRKGHVARLPKILRDKVNQMLADGVEYADIIAELQKSTNPLVVTRRPSPRTHALPRLVLDGRARPWNVSRHRLQTLSAHRLHFCGPRSVGERSEPERSGPQKPFIANSYTWPYGCCRGLVRVTRRPATNRNKRAKLQCVSA